MSSCRLSASTPLACSMTIRLFNALCSCSVEQLPTASDRCCRMPIVATSARAWPPGGRPRRVAAGRAEQVEPADPLLAQPQRHGVHRAEPAGAAAENRGQRSLSEVGRRPPSPVRTRSRQGPSSFCSWNSSRASGPRWTRPSGAASPIWSTQQTHRDDASSSTLVATSGSGTRRRRSRRRGCRPATRSVPPAARTARRFSSGPSSSARPPRRRRGAPVGPWRSFASGHRWSCLLLPEPDVAANHVSGDVCDWSPGGVRRRAKSHQGLLDAALQLDHHNTRGLVHHEGEWVLLSTRPGRCGRRCLPIESTVDRVEVSCALLIAPGAVR